MKNKFYVVWEGREPGIYDNWEDCLEQIEHFPGARYRSYDTSAEAAAAFRESASEADKLLLKNVMESLADARQRTDKGLPREVDPNGWAVDASCMGNPGVMEYQGVDLATGTRIFKIGPFQDATNNIGEFLALVHAMALMYNKGEKHTIYSDSITAISWVRKKKVGTTLKHTPRNEKVFQLIERALIWLHTHSERFNIIKWDTQRWGEIPADFGRK